jgi:glycosyltransferase involved in cell wall biosynthesis
LKILWIPHTAWRIPQRAHLFCRALAENHEVHVTDYAADFSSLRDYFSIRYANNFRYRISREGNLTIHGVPRISPALFTAPLRQWNQSIFSRLVARLINRYRIDVVVGTFVVPPPKASRLVFDWFDDNVAYWTQSGRNPSYAEEILRTENAYLQSADVVVAASSVLAERARARTTHPVDFIPNGVDLERFRNVDGDRLRRTWNAKGTIIGMLGNHDKAEELIKVLDAAEMLSQEEFHFIIAGRGSAIPLAKKYALKKRLTSVEFREAFPIFDAAEVVCAFDIGLCPYRKSPAADAASPMRLLFYSAAGLPTVCTNLEEVRRMHFPNVVSVEDGPDALAEGIRHARRLPRSRPALIAKYDLPRLAKRYEKILSGRSNTD